MSDSDWVVWSYEHRSWWASQRCGYVNSLLLAGLYTEEEAKEIERGANRGGKINEQARPLAVALADERLRWDRRGPMVVDLLTSARLDTARMDWMQGRVDGSGETLSFGGVCYWSLSVQRGGPRSASTRLGAGDDLRGAIDAAITEEENEAIGAPIRNETATAGHDEGRPETEGRPSDSHSTTYDT